MLRLNAFGLAFVLVMVCLFSPSLNSWATPSRQALQPALQLYRQGQYQQALQQFNQLAQTHKEDGRPVYYQALCLVQLGRLQEAQKRYQQVTLLYPNTETALAAHKGLKLLASSYGGSAPLDPPPAPSGSVLLQAPAVTHSFAFQPF
jgi:tetratricopeptide (TPR) repeat protein